MSRSTRSRRASRAARRTARRRSLARSLSLLVVASVVALLCLAAASTGGQPRQASGTPDALAPITSGVTFDPSLIISDRSFFDYSSMTETEIQRFLASTSCVPSASAPCLADYRQRTPTRAARGPRHCSRYQGAASEPASRIIWRVAQTCRISPKVLLVLLQKEQSLLTRPTASGYERATGYACPDHGDCDSAYFGFFNQVYNAARQFREYTLHPTHWRYRVGTQRVQFSPDPSCGSSNVAIANQATANLYNYTPYQPSPKAIANPGVADRCSTFGNLNFAALYRQWFGSPLAGEFPAPPVCRHILSDGRCGATGA